MPNTAEPSAYTPHDPAALLAEAAQKLDQICRAVGLVDQEPSESVDYGRPPARLGRVIARLIAEREDIRDHARSLNWRLPAATCDADLASRLLAEVTQLEWMSRHCVNRLRLALPEATRTVRTARAS